MLKGLRIAIFSESFEPVINGVTTSIQTLRPALREQGHETFVFAPAFPGHTDADPHVFRFPSVRPPTARDYPLAIPFRRGMTALMRMLDIDVIHTQTPFMLGWLGLRLGRRLGIPVVTTNHTQYAEYTHYLPVVPVRWSRAALIGMLRRYYDACDVVATPSEANRQILLSYGVRREVRVVPTGQALDIARDPATRQAIRAGWGVPSDSTVLLYVGRLAKEKNLELLLDALRHVSADRSDIRLVFVGGGPYTDELRREVARRRLAARVIVPGAVPRDQVGRVYCGGDVFVFPSMTETQGLVLGEALAAGLPCVAVNAGGSPEMVRHEEDGFLCGNDPREFASRVNLLLGDSDLRRRFSERAIENAQRFRPEQMALTMLGVYQTALREAPGHARL